MRSKSGHWREQHLPVQGSETERWPPGGDGVAERLTSALPLASLTENSGFSVCSVVREGAPFHRPL